MRAISSYLILLLLVFSSCKSEKKLSDLEQIEANVRSYFFLSDSVDIQIEILDTLHLQELDEMLTAVNSNMNLIQGDIDTLSLMIDEQAYNALHIEQDLEKLIVLKKNSLQDSLQAINLIKTQYQLKQAQLKDKQMSFKQTNRILLHLKRSVWADVAGFNIEAKYILNGEQLNFDLLLDAEFSVVD